MTVPKIGIEYNDFARGNGSGHCRDATMLRDTLVGLIEPMLRQRGSQSSRAVHCGEGHRTIDPHASKIPAPKGRNFYTNGERRFSISR